MLGGLFPSRDFAIRDLGTAIAFYFGLGTGEPSLVAVAGSTISTGVSGSSTGIVSVGLFGSCSSTSSCITSGCGGSSCALAFAA